MIEDRRPRAILGKMKLKAPNILQARRLGRAADKRGEVLTVRMWPSWVFALTCDVS
jgi:hypothetical protein